MPLGANQASGVWQTEKHSPFLKGTSPTLLWPVVMWEYGPSVANFKKNIAQSKEKIVFIVQILICIKYQGSDQYGGGNGWVAASQEFPSPALPYTVFLAGDEVATFFECSFVCPALWKVP